MEDSVAVKANREVEAMGEVGDAAGEAGAGNGGVKEQAKGEGEGGEAGDAAGEVGLTAWERLGLPFKLGTGLNLT